MLHLGVEFGTQQDDDRGNPQPGHEADDRTHRNQRCERGKRASRL